MRTADTDFSCPFLILQNITMMERNVSHMKVLLINGSPHEKDVPIRRSTRWKRCSGKTAWKQNWFPSAPIPFVDVLPAADVARKAPASFLIWSMRSHPSSGVLTVWLSAVRCTTHRQMPLVALLDQLFYSTPFDKTMKVGAAVASARRGGLTATFDELNKYFTISGMPVAAGQY